MSKQSGYLQRQEAQRGALLRSAEAMTRQFMMDTLQITMNKEFGWGFDRLMQLCLAWEKICKEYNPALRASDTESDVAQAHMDRALSRIVAGRMELIPFEERYPDLKTVVYDKRRKSK